MTRASIDPTALTTFKRSFRMGLLSATALSGVSIVQWWLGQRGILFILVIICALLTWAVVGRQGLYLLHVRSRQPNEEL
jgi:hypothetical protein